MPTTGSTTCFLFFITISTFPFTPKGYVQVKYSKDPVWRMETQPLTLKCTAEYEKNNCSIYVIWCLIASSTQCQPLTDPDLYLIHMNETQTEGKRERDTFITFKQLNINDTGFYQCKADCLNTRTSAIGHVISVNVTGDPNKGQKNVNWSNRCSVDMFLLTSSVFIFLWTMDKLCK